MRRRGARSRTRSRRRWSIFTARTNSICSRGNVRTGRRLSRLRRQRARRDRRRRRTCGSSRARSARSLRRRCTRTRCRSFAIVPVISRSAGRTRAAAASRFPPCAQSRDAAVDYLRLPEGRRVHPYAITVHLAEREAAWVAQHQIVQTDRSAGPAQYPTARAAATAKTSSACAGSARRNSRLRRSIRAGAGRAIFHRIPAASSIPTCRWSRIAESPDGRPMPRQMSPRQRARRLTRALQAFRCSLKNAIVRDHASLAAASS